MDSLDDLIATWLDEEMQESPVRATALGIDGHDGELGHFAAADFERKAARDTGWLNRLNGIDRASLTKDEEIDLDLLRSSLRGRQISETWQGWRRDPATYLGPCLSGVFQLFLTRMHPEPELAAFATSRLRQVPEVLDQAKANLDPQLASRLIVERGMGQCKAGVTYARDLVPAEVSDDKARAALADAGREAAAAFESFAGFLGDLADKAEGTWVFGEERYSALLQEKELLGYGARDMREKGRAAWSQLDAEMTDLAKRIDPSAAGWREVVEQCNREHASTPEAMREEYERVTQQARQFLADHGLVTLPDGEECKVVPSPPFQRPVLAVASYNAPPAFKPSRTGHFFVPFPPDGTSAEDVQKRLETNGHHSIPTIAVHEAYPGHHWHLVWMQEGARPLRRVIGTSYFTEGWALYAERLMVENNFFADDRKVLCHLDARIFRAARIIVDTSLHMGDMSFEEAVEFMRAKASLSEPTARAEVGRYCAWPTQASSYLTGSLEIERIRSRFLAEGKGDVRQFNDTIAGSGQLPIALAERAVLG
jgi:uncharacterized protein (DUF885 family)